MSNTRHTFDIDDHLVTDRLLLRPPSSRGCGVHPRPLLAARSGAVHRPWRCGDIAQPSCRAHRAVPRTVHRQFGRLAHRKAKRPVTSRLCFDEADTFLRQLRIRAEAHRDRLAPPPRLMGFRDSHRSCPCPDRACPRLWSKPAGSCHPCPECGFPGSNPAAGHDLPRVH